MELTIVIPVYNSEKTIGLLVERLHGCLSARSFEVILVNDGSTDRSGFVIDQLADRYPAVRAISLRRNFGEFNAVLCGLTCARGQFTAIIDDDCQNPPEAILTLLDAANAGQYDVVYSLYAQKQHHWFRNLGSRLVNILTTASLGKPRELYLSSFKLIRREVVEEIVRYQGPYPYIDGLIFRVTDRVTSVEVPHLARSEGQSGYTTRKLIGLFLNVFIGYSLWPVRLFTGLGLGLTGLAGVSGLGMLIAGLVRDGGIAGWLIVSWLIVFGLGIQLLFLGVLGEYLGKLFMSHSGLPAFVVRSDSGITLPNQDPTPTPPRKGGA